VKALSSDNQFWRLTAARLLVGRGDTDVLNEPLLNLVNKKDLDAKRLNKCRDCIALWALEGLNCTETDNSALGVVKGALYIG